MLGWLWRMLVGRFREPPLPDFPPLPPLPPLQAVIVCYHIWKTEQTINVNTPSGGLAYHQKELRCTKCGNWKLVSLKT